MVLDGLSLYILVAQGVAKLQEVKVGDTKKIRNSNPSHTRVVQIGQSGRFFFQISNFDIWQSLEVQRCIVSHLKAQILEQMDFT